jgi:FkbM family methyltransferase
MNYNLLFNHIQPKSFIDIGAHIGDFTQIILSKNPECKCLMIEANLNCEPYLKQTNQPYIITALSSVENKIPLFIENINPIGTGASLYKENTIFYEDGKYQTIDVETKKLDNLDIFPNQMIDLIKIDTQGSEYDILIGGEKTIKRTKYILLEVSLIEYNKGAHLIEDVVNKMREYYFKIEDIIEYHYNNNQIFQMDILFKNIYI